MRSKLEPYVFLYSHLNNHFESFIVEGDLSTIQSMRFRARHNSQREIKFYGLLAIKLNVKNLNKQLNDSQENDSHLMVFKSIENKITNLGF